MTLAELQEIERTSMVSNYARFPVEFVRGEGARLWDSEGNEYLDFLAGISVLNVGHCHPRVVEAGRDQVGRLTHATNLYYTAPALELSAALSRRNASSSFSLSLADRFFCRTMRLIASVCSSANAPAPAGCSWNPSQ